MYYLLDDKLLNIILAYLSKKPYMEVANIIANISRLSPVDLPDSMNHNINSMHNKESGKTDNDKGLNKKETGGEESK